MTTLKRKIASIAVLLPALTLITILFYYAGSVKDANVDGYNRLRVIRALLANENQAVIVLSPDGRIEEWSAAATTIFGWHASEVLGSRPDFLLPAGVWDKDLNNFSAHAAADPRHVIGIFAWAYNNKGKLVHVRIRISSFVDDGQQYRIALIEPAEYFQNLPELAKPAAVGMPIQPKPQSISDYSGTYTPFQ